MKIRYNLASYTQIVAIIVLFILLILSIARLGNNFIKIYTEERQWIFLTDEQKREKIFGEIYSYISFIQNNTSNKSSIISFNADAKTYYLGRYFLYPKKFISYAKQSDFVNNINSNIYDYVIYKATKNDDMKDIDNALSHNRYILIKIFKKDNYTYQLYKKYE